ncbi:MAG: extracellular solute-binding protein [Clostridia bacterium]|nr:extracellular solute-binding protein [Clostridia bacterium]
MKKLLTLVLALAMVLSCCCFATAEGATEEVVYYCSIGAYLIKLQEEVDNWNATTGAEKGVYITIESNINTYGTDLDALMQAGTHFDLVDATGHDNWVAQGWILDLNTVENDELAAMIEGYAPYMKLGLEINQGKLISMPLEVVPLKMAVNTDLFEANGLELPKTWDDIVECAKVITENGNGEVFGYGWSTWTGCTKRLTMKSSMNSTGKGWFDPNTETYDFSIFKKPFECVKTMYENGYMLGADDLGIDEIRAQFAAGKVGMFPAPSYDYAVYTSQFPAECNWTVIDMPTIEEGEAPYKGVYLDRAGCSIDAVSYEGGSDAHKAAVLEAFMFLNSDELNGAIYASGGMIPYKTEVIEATELDPEMGPQFAIFADIANYAGVNNFPDKLIPLEGDNYNTVFIDYMHGAIDDLDAAIEDLNARYNEAYQTLKDDGDIDLSDYAYEYSLEK